MTNLTRVCGSFMLLAAIVLTSCSTSNEVVSNSLLQKRKYRKGYHLQDVFKKKKEQEDVASETRAIAGHESKVAEESVGTLSEIDQLLTQLESFKKEETAQVASEGEQQIQAVTSSELRNKEQVRLKELASAHEAPVEKADRKNVREIKKLLNSANSYAGSGNEGIISLVAGAVNFFVTWVIPVVGIAIGVVAIIYGLRAIKSSDDSNRLMGIIGAILGGISALFSLFWTLYIIFVVILVAGTA